MDSKKFADFLLNEYPQSQDIQKIKKLFNENYFISNQLRVMMLLRVSVFFVYFIKVSTIYCYNRDVKYSIDSLFQGLMGNKKLLYMQHFENDFVEMHYEVFHDTINVHRIAIVLKRDLGDTEFGWKVTSLRKINPYALPTYEETTDQM